jgi:hypothetical protein
VLEQYIKTQLKFKKLFLSALVLLSLSVIFFLVSTSIPVASAASGLVTRGDAEGIFYSGCGEVIDHGTPSQTNPCEDRFRARLFPFGSPVKNVCVDDWHVLVVIDLEGVDVTNPLLATRDLTIDDLKATTVNWTLDGVPVNTQTLPVRVFPLSEQQVGLQAYSFTNGTLFAPGAISVGSHVLTLQLNDAAFPVPLFTRTVIVDPSGTGACLLP